MNGEYHLGFSFTIIISSACFFDIQISWVQCLKVVFLSWPPKLKNLGCLAPNILQTSTSLWR